MISKNSNKNIEKINQTKLIEKICDVTAIPSNQISTVLNCLEKNVSDILSSASQDRDVQVKLFDGLIIESKHSEPKTKRNNITGETIIVPERLNVSGRITRLFEKKINQ